VHGSAAQPEGWLLDDALALALDRLVVEQFALGIGSALSVLLFLSVLVIAWLIVKIFKVDLAQARQE
jgi:multiple sugar transport system permease protein